MNNINNFHQTHFNQTKKRSVFFHRNSRFCSNFNRPKVKIRLNVKNFYANHQQMICTCKNATLNLCEGLVAGAGHGSDGHGGHGAGNRQFVTLLVFNAFANIVNQNFINANNQINIIDTNMLNLTNNINNLTIQD